MTTDTSAELQTSVESPAAWTRRLTVVVPPARVARVRERVVRTLAQRLRLPGFRPGHVPARLVEQRFGSAVDQEVQERLLQETYREALAREGLEPIAPAEIERWEVGEQGVTFVARFDVRPTPEIARVHGFTVTRPKLEVTDTDVAQALESLREDLATYGPLPAAERPAVGDVVTVEIRRGDEAPQRVRFPLGEGRAWPDLEDAVRTLAPGEEADFELRDPSQPERVERVHLRLVEGQRRELPSLDDAFAQRLGLDSLESLRQRVRADLEAAAARRADEAVHEALLQWILDAHRFDVPPSLVERTLDLMLGDSRAEEASDEAWAQQQQLREALRPQAEAAVRRRIVLERIADQYGLHATAEQVGERVTEIARRLGRPAADVRRRMERSGDLERLEWEITEANVFAFLVERNTVVPEGAASE